MTTVPTIWDVVAVNGRRHPDAAAVRGAYECTYTELLDRVESLAEAIRSAGAGPGRFIAVQAPTASAAVMAALAIARVRCSMLPINPDSPPAHRSTLMADARPVMVLREVDPGTLVIEPIESVEPADAVGGNGAAGVDDSEDEDLEQIAYVLYTSGSTGRPKGVMVSHQALLDRFGGLARVPGLRPGDSMLAMTAPTFDISLVEILLPLFVGGTVVAAPPSARLDPEIFMRFVREHRPDVLQATPSYWRLALACGWQGDPDSRLWCGGEALTSGLARKLLPHCGELWNLYGPTEATLWASTARVVSDGPVDLGRALLGTGLCLEDDDGEPVRADQPERPGEILLYGAGLAVGYLRRPELTADRFADRRTPEGVRRCYRTGDRAQYRDDGTLEFLGRNDGQVKLRGHRIELSGLEAIAEEHPAVREAVAVIREADRPETAHIAVFVVADGTVTGRELRRWLAERLPAGSRPGFVSVEEALPRTVAGKIDRVLLAATERGKPLVV